MYCAYDCVKQYNPFWQQEMQGILTSTLLCLDTLPPRTPCAASAPAAWTLCPHTCRLQEHSS